MKLKSTIYWGIACLVMFFIFIFLKKNPNSITVSSSIYQAQIDEFNREYLVSVDRIELSEENDAKAIVAQEKNQRTFINDKFNLVSEVSIFDIENLNRVQVLDYNNSELTVYDNTDGYIKTLNIDADSIEVKVIAGNGKGRGPGEIGMVYEAGIHENIIYISDAENMKVSLFQREVGHIADVPIKYSGRLLFGDKFIVNFNIRGNKLFDVYKYDKERNVAKINYKAGNILGENQSKLLNLLDGFTATNKVRSEYYYSFLYMGYFATIKINPLDHTLQYSLIETIEHPGYIAGKALFKNGIKRIDDSIVVSYGIDANEDEIFIIGGFIEDENGYKTVVDTYDVDTYLYKYSTTIPGVFTYIKSFDNTLIIYDADEKIGFYEYR